MRTEADAAPRTTRRETRAGLDAFGKIPEFKYCAVRVRRGGEVAAHSSFGGGQLLEPLEA